MWEEKIDIAGGIYYYNPKTTARLWTKPEGVTVIPAAATAPPPANPEPAPAAAVDNSDLPEGWEKKVDIAGAVYYYNAATTERLWTKPTSPAGVSA